MTNELDRKIVFMHNADMSQTRSAQLSRTVCYIRAYAKINLTLDVLGRRTDGYHELATIMQTVDLYDTICLSTSEDQQVHISCSTDALSNDDNLAARAAHLIQQFLSAPQGVHIELYKRIPTAAGLGGGSSDAAAVLLALQQWWQLHLSPTDLLKWLRRSVQTFHSFSLAVWLSVKGVASASRLSRSIGQPRCAGSSCSNPPLVYPPQQCFVIYPPATIPMVDTHKQFVLPSTLTAIHHRNISITAWNAAFWNNTRQLPRPKQPCLMRVHLLSAFLAVGQPSLPRSLTSRVPSRYYNSCKTRATKSTSLVPSTPLSFLSTSQAQL